MSSIGSEERCSNPGRGRNEVWALKSHWGTGSPRPRREGRMGGRRPLRPAAQSQRPEQRARADAARGAHKPTPGRHIRRQQSPEDSKIKVPQPNGVSAGNTPGCPEPPHLERSGTGSSRRRNPAQRNERLPEEEGRDRNRLTNRKLGFETETLWGLNNLLVSLRVVILHSGCQGSAHGGKGARPFRDCDHYAHSPYDPCMAACAPLAAHAPATGLRPGRVLRRFVCDIDSPVCL